MPDVDSTALVGSAMRGDAALGPDHPTAVGGTSQAERASPVWGAVRVLEVRALAGRVQSGVGKTVIIKSAMKRAKRGRGQPRCTMTPFTQITALLEEAGVMAHPFETVLIGA